MKPRSGENPPLNKSSRSHSWRAVRSQEGHSREWAFNSALRSAEETSSTRSPPWGGIRWLAWIVKCLNLQDTCVILSNSIVPAAKPGHFGLAEAKGGVLRGLVNTISVAAPNNSLGSAISLPSKLPFLHAGSSFRAGYAGHSFELPK